MSCSGIWVAHPPNADAIPASRRLLPVDHRGRILVSAGGVPPISYSKLITAVPPCRSASPRRDRRCDVSGFVVKVDKVTGQSRSSKSRYAPHAFACEECEGGGVLALWRGFARAKLGRCPARGGAARGAARSDALGMALRSGSFGVAGGGLCVKDTLLPVPAPVAARGHRHGRLRCLRAGSRPSRYGLLHPAVPSPLRLGITGRPSGLPSAAAELERVCRA